jgi:hypothetical protein
MSLGPMVSLALLAPLVVLGCATPTYAHRCDVPQPVVEAAPGSTRIPLAVAVRHSSVPGAPADRTEQRDPNHTWSVAPEPPSRAMLERLAETAFERVLPDPDGAASGGPPVGADAVLDVRLGQVGFSWTPIGVGPYAAQVDYHVTLRGAGGAPITSFDVEGVGSRAPILLALTHCAGIGDAVALAMQDAGAKLLTGLSGDPSLAAFLQARGVPAPALALRPVADYPPAPSPPRPDPLVPGPPPTDAPAPAARPVVAPEATAPVRRSARLAVGLGAFLPDETAGALEGAATGFGFLLDAETRFAPYLAFAAEGGWFAAPYAKAAVAPGTTRAMALSTWYLGLGLRAILPGDGIEPWIGVLPCALLTTAEESFSLRMSMNDWAPAWSAGLQLGAGIRVYPGGPHVISLDARRLFARASLGTLPGDVAIGGWSLTASYGVAIPP